MRPAIAANEVFIGVCFLWVGVSIGNFVLNSKLLDRYLHKLSTTGRSLLVGKVMSILGIIFLSYIICGCAHISAVFTDGSPSHDFFYLVVLFICSVVSVLTGGILAFFLPKIRQLTDNLELTEEGKLQDVENQFLEVIEACQQSITNLSTDLVFLKGNGSSTAFFGSNYVGKPILDFVHGEDCETLLQATKCVDPPHRFMGRRTDIEAHMDDNSPLLLHNARRQLTVEYRVRSPDCDADSADKIWIWVESKVVYQGGTGSSQGHYMMLSRNVDAKKEKEVLFLEKQRAQEHENAAKLNYITCTAHDLKTPLQSFIFALDLMEQLGPLSKEQKEVLMHARVSYSLMSLTIQQTMDSSKVLMGGKLVPHKQSVKLSDIIFKVSAIIDSYTRQVPIVFRLSTRMSNAIITDEEWLWQMLLNLLTNACKFTTTGRVVVDIHLSDRSNDTLNELSSGSKDSMVLFRVSDTGVGVAEINVPVLFNMFSQAQAGQLSGTGLGLFGIRVRAEGLNGLYGMHNRSDGKRGSVFWIKIPYVPDVSLEGDRPAVGVTDHASPPPVARKNSDGFNICDNVAALLEEFDGFSSAAFKNRASTKLDDMCNVVLDLPAMLEGGAPTPPGDRTADIVRIVQESDIHGTVDVSDSPLTDTRARVVGAPTAFNEMCIFVVDDAPAIRKLMKRTLERQGVGKVELFENGDVALRAMMQKEVDVVFMDIQMPVMSGPEAVRRFRAFEKTSGRKKRQMIIAASANFTPEAEVELLGERMFDVLYSKPLQSAEIISCIEKCKSHRLSDF